MNSFIRKLTLYSIILFALYGVLVFILPDRFISDVFYAFIPFFYLITLITRLMLNKYQSQTPDSFSTRFIITTVVRFILYVTVLLIYSFTFPEDAIPFIITFFVFYFVYTTFEVSYLYHNLKK